MENLRHRGSRTHGLHRAAAAPQPALVGSQRVCNLPPEFDQQAMTQNSPGDHRPRQAAPAIPRQPATANPRRPAQAQPTERTATIAPRQQPAPTTHTQAPVLLQRVWPLGYQQVELCGVDDAQPELFSLREL